MEIKKRIQIGFIFALALIAFYFLLKEGVRSSGERTPDLQSISTERDLVEAGRKIFLGKGQCSLCHTLGGRGRGKCPDLEGVGARLTREFLYETLTKPDAYIKLDFEPVEPRRFPARMPKINKPPIGLTDREILTVISFLQSQGGAVTVSPSELERGSNGSL